MPCDTACFVDKRGRVYFMKNSDRHPNEEQIVESHPAVAATVGPAMTMKCTYLDIDQPARTHAVLISRPVHQWGAEMGVNEHGVAIGNEAVFSCRVAVPDQPRHLTGLDLVRLALERSRTADEAVDVVSGLLARYGPCGGNCGFQEHPFWYHNGFVIAQGGNGTHSPPTVLLMFVIGAEWAVRRVCPDAHNANCDDDDATSFVSLSNALPCAIGVGDLHRHSPGLVATAVANGWCRSADDFDLRTAYLGYIGMHRLFDDFGRGLTRQCRMQQLFDHAIKSKALSPLPVLDHSPTTRVADPPFDTSCLRFCFDALRDHYPCAAPSALPWLSSAATAVVSHAPKPTAIDRIALPASSYSTTNAHDTFLNQRSSIFGISVCMHPGFGPVRHNATTASLVVVVSPLPPGERHTPQTLSIWATSTSSPCTSAFKPLWFCCNLLSVNQSGREASRASTVIDVVDGELEKKRRMASRKLWTLHERCIRRIALSSADGVASRVELRASQSSLRHLARLARAIEDDYVAYVARTVGANVSPSTYHTLWDQSVARHLDLLQHAMHEPHFCGIVEHSSEGSSSWRFRHVWAVWGWAKAAVCGGHHGLLEAVLVSAYKWQLARWTAALPQA